MALAVPEPESRNPEFRVGRYGEMALYQAYISSTHNRRARVIGVFLLDAPAEPGNAKSMLEADMLITLEDRFSEVQCAILKTHDGERGWYGAAFRTARLTSSSGKSRGMKPSLRQRGKWWN